MNIFLVYPNFYVLLKGNNQIDKNCKCWWLKWLFYLLIYLQSWMKWSKVKCRDQILNLIRLQGPLTDLNPYNIIEIMRGQLLINPISFSDRIPINQNLRAERSVHQLFLLSDWFVLFTLWICALLNHTKAITFQFFFFFFLARAGFLQSNSFVYTEIRAVPFLSFLEDRG